MRIIVPGGSGLIGRALASSLTADNHEVIILSRNARYVKSLPRGARAEQWDARTAAGWGRLADGADAIVNLAGQSIAGESLFPILFRRWTSKQKRRIRDSRLHAGQAVLQAIEAAKQKPRVLIQQSAVGYYGTLRDEELTEEAYPGIDFLARVCWDWENSTSHAEVLGIRRAVIRSALVLSAAGGLLPMVLLPFKFFAGGRIGSGRQWFPWIHIADEVNAIRFLIENQNARGPFNLTAPNPITNAQLAKTVGRVLRRPSFFPVPGIALRLLMGEKATIVLEGQRPLPKRLLDRGYTFQFPELEPALRHLLERKRPSEPATMTTARP